MEFATVKAAVSPMETPAVCQEWASRGAAEGRVSKPPAGDAALSLRQWRRVMRAKVRVAEGSGKAGGISPEQIMHINKRLSLKEPGERHRFGKAAPSCVIGSLRRGLSGFERLYQAFRV